MNTPSAIEHAKETPCEGHDSVFSSIYLFFYLTHWRPPVLEGGTSFNSVRYFGKVAKLAYIMYGRFKSLACFRTLSSHLRLKYPCLSLLIQTIISS